MAQLDRALVYGTRGYRFESYRVYKSFSEVIMHKIIVSLFFSSLSGLTIQNSNHSVEFNQYLQSDLMSDGIIDILDIVLVINITFIS